MATPASVSISLCIIWMFLAGALSAEIPSLRVGMDLSYPPFETINPEGDPAGISVDIADALGHSLGTEILIENIPFIGLIPALKSGYLDLIISSMTPTEERKKSIDFSLPYISTGLCLLVNSHSSLADITEANNPAYTIVVKTGTSGELYAAKHLSLATVHVLDKEAMCILEVVQGKADAFIYDEFSVYLQWKRNPQTTKAISPPFQKEQWAMGVRKGNQQLLDQVNTFIERSPVLKALTHKMAYQ